MTRLKDQVSLQGKFEEITVADLRCAPGDVLNQVEMGKTFVITRNGKHLAVLSKVPGAQLAIQVNSKGEISYKL